MCAVRDVLPEVEHRLCTRHIYANWSKRHQGASIRDLFWDCARSTFEEQFNDNLRLIENESKEDTDALVEYPLKSWVRAFFSDRCLSPSVDNMSESFNQWIDDFRYLPVLRMFDGMRQKMMDKWAKSDQKVRKWKGDYSPKCLELYELNRRLATNCRVRFNGDEGYEVDEGRYRHVVCLRRKICTCRLWDLTGIPCQHGVSAY